MDAAPSPSPLPETISAKLRVILLGLRAMLGVWRVEPTLAIALYRQIGRTIGQIERLLVRFQAGKLWCVTRRDASPARHDSKKPAVILPRRFGWLLQAGRHQAAYFGSQLQAVLSAPEIKELLAASPQARRILRPLCRALAVEVPGVSAPPIIQRGERRRIYKPRAKPEPFQIPLPRGALAWARREGFGKKH